MAQEAAGLVLRGRGEAGRGEDDVRSDLHASVELRDDGGLDLRVTSKVEASYGDAIRAQAREVLDRLGVAHATLTLRDQGGLPYVIEARIEAAVRSAGGGVGRDARPERAGSLPAPSPRDRLRRSRLYLPGNEPRYFVNAGLHAPDAVILDLEDSVHPAAKDAARLVVRNALRCVDFGDAERMVRINQLPLGLRDLDEILPEQPDLVLLPKVEDPEQIRAVDAAITRALGSGPDARPVWLMPILESALGFERAFAIATASERVVALTIGLEDYTADLGVVKTREGSETLWARSRVVNAAKAARVQAIDSVYGDVGDLDGLRAWCRASKALGFEGMGCLHPRQIVVLHDGYAPERAELDKARRIVAAFQAAEAKGLGVVSLGSKMIDPPVVLRARRLVQQARAMGLLAEREEGAS